MKTKILLYLCFDPENDDIPLIQDEVEIEVIEEKKSYFNPQELFMSDNAKKQISEFLQKEKNKHAGYTLDMYPEILAIDGFGDDWNV